MHRPSKILGCNSLPNATSIAAPYTVTSCDFLAPAIRANSGIASRGRHRENTAKYRRGAEAAEIPYNARSRATECHRSRPSITRAPCLTHTSARWKRHGEQEKDSGISWTQRRSISGCVDQPPPQDDIGSERASKRPRRIDNGTGWDFFESNTLEFARKSRLPLAFFHDLNVLHKNVGTKTAEQAKHDGPNSSQALLKEQMELMDSVRQLEEKLARAKISLSDSLRKTLETREQLPATSSSEAEHPKVVLSKGDYKNLVDLYFHTHTSRFDPESPHASPTPTFLEDYVFKLSEDFAPPQAYAEFYEDEAYESPLKEVELMIQSRQLREVSAFKVFVDLLLDDRSSNAALFKAYKRLPQPGVAFLPKGTIRVFLQRMSTPWQKSEKSMIRYLSLIDDMQKANLPISRAEWASAIYLAGRSFSKVTDTEVHAAMRLWKQMEQEAGVKAHHVTFNILFDIAVRANKFPLAQTILKEMHDRGLHLNRLGRVSVIYYHGLRGDGDAVRKAYRDFVDAGEIVDTLVLNCVMAALYNAQEPAAAEQIYERMKSLHVNTRRETRDDGSTAYYRQYPGPGSEVIDRELAANSLHRTLLFSRRLKEILPEHHKALQEIIPLRPDHVTYRTMISYHANMSGNLNRITVLISEMSELFGLPLQSIHYQLLFKGFALHGATRNPDATWSLKRLNMAWDSCRQEIKDGQLARRRARMTADLSTPQLPSIRVINEAGTEEVPTRPINQFKRLSEWDNFVLDLAAFPRERRKHIERVHAELFDEEHEKKDRLIRNPFSRVPVKEAPPPKQEHYYPLGDMKLDEQEGEYVLPSPILAIDPSSAEFQDPFFPNRTSSEGPNSPSAFDTNEASADAELPDDDHSLLFNPNAGPSAEGPPTQPDQARDTKREDEDERDSQPIPTNSKYQVEATRALVCWLLRAYANATGSRSQVEEIWNSVRKLWRSRDPNDQASVIRVLRRCLRNCDRYGPPM
ncbi:hypothetical protein CLCR_02743 [Cladophialophora carrionii]|uniref:Pentatricopeptide repeat protein n=1 Tax=Cladophialophora carrionii TaxID=86049 RepID=A0A1C1D2M9_9EURO|nr:hypothetical protein CLCR_02743 [Cladophialophora carrionii]